MGQKSTVKKVSVAGMLWLSVLFSVASRPVSAQIAYSSEEKAEKQTKKSIRDSRKYQADYKDSHLNTEVYTYERGETGRKKSKGDNTMLYADKPDNKGLKRFFKKKK